MKRSLALIVSLSLAAVPGLACGGEKKAAPAAGGSAGGVTIDMKNIKFVPEQATVKAGQTVTWTNSDAVAHTATKVDGPGDDFDSGTITAGKNYQHKFTERGTVNYYCTIHPDQKGSLEVQ